MTLSTILAKLALPSLAIIALLSTYKLAYDNGYLTQLSSTVVSAHPIVPDTNLPLRTHYTGFTVLDNVLAQFVVVFSALLDGKRPGVSLQGAHFVGQGVAVWVLVLLEGYRIGNARQVLAYATITGLLMENILMAFVLPIYLLLQLLKSPTSQAPSLQSDPRVRKAALLIHPSELAVIPWSIALGCFIPTFIAIFAPTGSNTQQIALVLRQLHPLLTAVAHVVLSIFTAPEMSPIGNKNREKRNARVLAALQPVYDFATYIAVIPHIAVVTLTLLSTFLPTLFTPEIATGFKPANAFLPPRFFPKSAITPAISVGHGTHIFLQWDEVVSMAAILVWAVAVNRQALAGQAGAPGLLRTLGEVVLKVAVGGPAAAAISLVRQRDAFVLSQGVDGEGDEGRKDR